MRKTTPNVIILLLVLIALAGVAQASETQVTSTYVGWNKAFNTAEMSVKIVTPETGKLVYAENYYSIDSYGNPKFYSSRRHEVTGLSFTMQRPKDGKGSRYSLVEKRLIANGKIVSTTWVDLRKSWS